MTKYFTREKDNFECRIAGGCPAEDWLCEIYGEYPDEGSVCKNCPFEEIINELGKYEDIKRNLEQFFLENKEKEEEDAK